MKRHVLGRRLLGGALAAMSALVACGGSSKSGGGATTTTDASAYSTAYAVCQQFHRTDVARNAEPQTMTDDQADLVFANLAQLLTPASQRDPKAWAKLQAVADRLRQQLAGGSASDDQIESTITKMADACQVARRAPKSAGPASTSTSTTPAPSTTSPA